MSASKHNQEYFRKHSEEYRADGKRHKRISKIQKRIGVGLVLLLFATVFVGFFIIQ